MKRSRIKIETWRNRNMIFAVSVIKEFITATGYEDIIKKDEDYHHLSYHTLRLIYEQASVVTKGIENTYNQRKAAQHFLKQVGSITNFFVLSKQIMNTVLPPGMDVENNSIAVLDAKGLQNLAVSSYALGVKSQECKFGRDI